VSPSKSERPNAKFQTKLQASISEIGFCSILWRLDVWRLGFLAAAIATGTVEPIAAADLASRTLLLDAALAGPVVVVVGERGTILRSTDNSGSWQAENSHSIATLTGVSFADAQHGWAVGHDALILATPDGGTTWTKQWQGENLSDSFLDVLALDARHIIAVGAYGLFVSTTDGGRTWARRKIEADDYHLNRITRGPTGTLYLAGEHGTLLRSRDGGVTWAGIPTEYEGSFYGLLPLDAHTLIAYGLRGRVFRSTNDGETWTAIETNETALLATAVTFNGGTLALAGSVRGILVSTDAGVTFGRGTFGPSTAIAELLVLPDGALLSVGEAGAIRTEPGRVVTESVSGGASDGPRGEGTLPTARSASRGQGTSTTASTPHAGEPEEAKTP
jgi:photosystem II stability/assembly factor-like uncharacterized protein